MKYLNKFQTHKHFDIFRTDKVPQKVANCGYCGDNTKAAKRRIISNERTPNSMTCTGECVKVLNSEKVVTQHESTKNFPIIIIVMAMMMGPHRGQRVLGLFCSI